MKKPKTILFVAIYLIFMKIITIPTIWNLAIPYDPKGDSIDFLFAVLFLLLKILIIANLIAAIGLAFIQEWARKVLLWLLFIDVVLGIISILQTINLSGMTSALSHYIFGVIIHSIIFLYLISSKARQAIEKYSASRI